jgi:hypothetical protein
MSHPLRHLAFGIVGLAALAALAAHAQGQAARSRNTSGATSASAHGDVAEAVASAQAAQQALVQAQTNLRLVAIEVRKKYETAPDTVRARAEVDAAAKDLNDIRAAATAALHADPDYILLQQDIDHVAGALDPQVSQSDLADVDRQDLAQAKMEYAARLHHMEEDALNQNPEYKDAQQRLVQASAHWTTTQSQLQTAMKEDPDLKSAQDAVARAQTDLIAADADLQRALIEHQEADQADYARNMYENGANDPNNANYYYNGYPFYGLYPAYPVFGGNAVTGQSPQPPASTSTPVPSWSPFNQVPSWSPFTPQPASSSTPVPSWSPFPSQPTPTKTGH